MQTGAATVERRDSQDTVVRQILGRPRMQRSQVSHLAAVSQSRSLAVSQSQIRDQDPEARVGWPLPPCLACFPRIWLDSWHDLVLPGPAWSCLVRRRRGGCACGAVASCLDHQRGRNRGGYACRHAWRLLLFGLICDPTIPRCSHRLLHDSDWTKTTKSRTTTDHRQPFCFSSPTLTTTAGVCEPSDPLPPSEAATAAAVCPSLPNHLPPAGQSTLQRVMNRS